MFFGRIFWQGTKVYPPAAILWAMRGKQKDSAKNPHRRETARWPKGPHCLGGPGGFIAPAKQTPRDRRAGEHQPGQGPERVWMIVAWHADLCWSSTDWRYHSFRRAAWTDVKGSGPGASGGIPSESQVLITERESVVLLCSRYSTRVAPCAAEGALT